MQEPTGGAVLRYIRGEMAEATPSTRQRAFEKVVAAALGSIPWVGQIAAIGVALKSEGEALKRDALIRIWLEEHEVKFARLGAAIDEILGRFESLGESIDDRLQSEDYLQLVRRSFRAWDRADSEEKRHYATNIMVNAGGTRVCTDDVVRLFVDQLDSLHELHLRVIHELYNNRGLTRLQIWHRIYGSELPRENSAEADLFRKVVSDLSLGRLLRQHRETTPTGQFVANSSAPRRPRTPGPRVVETSFDNDDQYELTALGDQLVHYVMTDATGRIEGPPRGI